MTGAVAFLNAHAPWILALSVFVGVAMPDLASIVRPALPFSVWGLLFLAMLRIDWESTLGFIQRPRLVIGAGAVMLLFSPIVFWLMVRSAGLPAGITTGLVLMASAPPIMSSPALALLLGLRAPLVLVLLMVATLIVPFTLPVMALELLGVQLSIDTLTLGYRLALMNGSALVCAVAARKIIGMRWIRGHDHFLGAGTVVLIVVFAVGMMDGIADIILSKPGHVAMVMVLAFAANLLLQIIGTLPFVMTGLQTAFSIGFSNGNRNMGILLAVLPTNTDPEILLYFAIGQFPIYMLPALQRPFFRKIMGRREQP